MAESIENHNYTNLWVENFSQKDVERYNSKWFKKFEKNAKHLEQVEVLKKYLSSSKLWLDAPVGSGRFYFEILHDKSKYFALDNSNVFLKYVKKKFNLADENLFKMNLYDIKIKKKKFDLISCFNTLFALNNIDKILKNFKNILSEDGILIFDVKYNSSKMKTGESDYKHFTKDEITKIIKQLNLELLEIIEHDFYDSKWFNNKKNSKVLLIKILFKIIYGFLNLIYKIPLFKSLFLNLQKMGFKKEKMIVVCKK